MYSCEQRCPLKGTPAITEGNLVITLPNVSVLTNRDILSFVVYSTIDQTNPLGTVSININGTVFPLKTRIGNDVRIDQMRSRRVYAV